MPESQAALRISAIAGGNKVDFIAKAKSEVKPRTAFFGLVHRRECLVPTWQGWLMFALLGMALLVVVALTIHPFLALTEPVAARLLVVEGWAPDYVLEKAKTNFERNGYGKLYVTGGPLERGAYLSGYKTYAELGAATLIRMGMRKDALEVVPAPFAQQDRTYASAVALRNRLRQHGAAEASINLISRGAHARRSRLLFQQAFGDGSRVGIMAIEDRDYDPRHWWEFSQGVRTVVEELVAYLYARFIFPWF